MLRDMSSLHSDPILQFQLWFSEAKKIKSLQYPHAMTVSTVGVDGVPDSRILLLKEVDDRGFMFFTNKDSQKGLQLAKHPFAALLFFWEPLGYQVRIQGRVEEVSDAESDAYFATRPRLSQIGSWASEQSRLLPDRAIFEQKAESFEVQFSGQDIPRPSYWGGYRVIPQKMEFWIERPFRWHDRFEFTRTDNASWSVRRLYP